VFISHSTKNAAFVDRLAERFRGHSITTWYAPRHMPGGYFAENIRQALNRQLRESRTIGQKYAAPIDNLHDCRLV
jgi:hypothetical protein